MISSGHRYHFRIGCSLGKVGQDDVLIKVSRCEVSRCEVSRCEVMEHTLKMTFVLHIEDLKIMKNDITGRCLISSVN